MNHIFRYIILSLLVTPLLTSCKRERMESDIVVTIAPLKYIVEQITGDDFTVSVLVPQGASPETFEPTPKQVADLNHSQLILSTGLIEFEKSLLHRLGNTDKVINLSKNIELIKGSCSHHGSHHDHHHGVDPHIWTSPRELKIMAANAHKAIMELYPDSTKYTTAYNLLISKLDKLDEWCEQQIKESNTRALIVYHPALTYYTRAYGIEQIAIEQDGKEPSAKHLSHLIDEARNRNVHCILYQAEYPKSVVEVISKDTKIEAEIFYPLSEDVEATIKHVTNAITGHNLE